MKQGDIISGLRGYNAQIQQPLTTRPNLPTTLGYTAGKYYPPGVIGPTVAAGSYGTGFVLYNIFLCRRAVTIDRIGIYNTAAVADHIRMAIYADDGGGHPAARVAESGEITLGGAAAFNAATISAILTPGLYWLGLTTDATVSLLCSTAFEVGGFGDMALGPIATASGITPIGTHVYAQLPATAPAITGLSAVGAPLICLRAA